MNQDDQLELFNLLQGVIVPKRNGLKNNKRRMNVSGAIPQTAVIGRVKYIKAKKVDDSLFTKQYPEVVSYLKELATKYFPDLEYSHIQINKNFQTLPHKDTNNINDSVIFSVGDFTGGELGLETEGLVDIRGKPFRFNGSKITHWTEPFEGTRYSLIYFKNNSI